MKIRSIYRHLLLSRKTRQTLHSGQTMIEILIATAVVALVMTALMLGMTLSIKNTSQARYKTIATQLAQQGMEVFRRERAINGFEVFASKLPSQVYCLNQDLPQNLDEFSGGTCQEIPSKGITFIREAAVTRPGDALRVVVTVSWEDSGVTRQVELVQEFAEWN